MARKKIQVVVERTEVCKNCNCSNLVESQEWATWYCHLMPPTVTYDILEQTNVSTLPVVAADHWCGQFRPKLNS
jgi:hypothetical protein